MLEFDDDDEGTVDEEEEDAIEPDVEEAADDQACDQFADLHVVPIRLSEGGTPHIRPQTRVGPAVSGNTPVMEKDEQPPPSAEFDATTAERIFPSLGAELRLQKGSDPNSPLAGLLAAAAGRQGPLDERAYSCLVYTYPSPRDRG